MAIIYGVRTENYRYRYVGQTKNLPGRIKGHWYRVNYLQRPLYSWMKKYGSRVRFDVLETVEGSQVDVDNAECKWIATLKPDLNLTAGGQSGWTIDEATREKIRISSTGRRHTEEAKAKISKGHLGRKKTAEHCAAISQAKRGKKLSLEAREAVAAGHRGLVKSAEHRESIKSVWKKRYKCAECDIIASPQLLGKHFRQSGHKGRHAIS
ncbi:G-I-Y Y-I-G endonuclease [Gordonia phage Sixama]|uniref:G-I-Y Y-I-G endonuclease n=1 Tax=Gordonia phage Sixama TaxID=2653271 RepID=A0A5Q2F6G7_9CAUD|nr:G-I-Y Y-I-G endonuclease [Gordonia phage Sixama]QGF20323.1 G-I-Y Y-I-G endonuclease [Gordonia phage Sixama]